MGLKINFIKLALLASIVPMTANAQEYPSGLQIPRSLQSQQVQTPALQPAVSSQSLQPIDILPKLAAPEEVLSPKALNQDQVFAQNEFKKQFAGSLNNDSTFEKLLSEAYEKNPAVNSARESVKIVDEQLNQAYSGFLPNVNFTYNKDYEKTSFDGGPDQTFRPDAKSFNLRQGIFGGGETYYAVKSAEARVASAQNELRSAEQDFLFNAITAYIDYIYTQKVFKLAENNENVLQEQLKAARERFVVGDATKTDVAQSEARIANAVSNKVLSSGEFVNAQANFKKIFGSEGEKNLPMPSNLPNIPATLEESIDLGLKNNPQLNQAKYLTESRDNDINAQASQLLPQVDLNGSVSESQSSTTVGLLDRDSQNVGVTVTVPIYSQGISYSRTREARDRRNQAKQQYNDTVNAVRSAIIQSWQRIATTKTNIDATKASLVASEFALDGVREEQKEGARTVLDVLDAEQERFAAETSHARAIKDSVLAIYNLKLVLGELNSKELGLSVAEYDPQKHYKNTRFKLIGF